MRRINSCMNKQLMSIYQHTLVLESLNLKLQRYLPESLINHCSVGSFTGGRLVIVVTESIFITELRYLLPTLRNQLRQDAGLYQLISIKIQVVLAIPKKLEQPQLTLRTLSNQTRDDLREAAGLCAYPPLKNVLLALANRSYG